VENEKKTEGKGGKPHTGLKKEEEFAGNEILGKEIRPRRPPYWICLHGN
jgi:hypothetical protein